MTGSAAPSGAAPLRLCPDRGTLSVTGPDAAQWLNGVLTCDVQACKPGEAVWGLALDRKGKIQSEIWVVAQESGYLISTSEPGAEQLFEQLDRMLVMEDAELENQSESHAWALLTGQAGAAESEAAASLHRVQLVELTARVCVYPRQSPPGWFDPRQALDDTAWLRLRLTHGLPEHGTDYSDKERPHEAGLERRAVDWSKGCYLGQEVVCMQDMRGKVTRRATLLRVDATEAAALSAGAEVLSSESSVAVGTLSSCAYLPDQRAWLAFSMLPLKQLETELWVQGPVSRHRAHPEGRRD